VHYFTFDDARTVAEYTHGIALPMAPFLGVVAAEPAGQEQVSAVIPKSVFPDDLRARIAAWLRP
jgi:hypothetical protein